MIVEDVEVVPENIRSDGADKEKPKLIKSISEPTKNKEVVTKIAGRLIPQHKKMTIIVPKDNKNSLNVAPNTSRAVTNALISKDQPLSGIKKISGLVRPSNINED